MKEREESLIRHRDRYCTTCSQEGNIQEASVSCQQCQTVLCTTCSELHKKIPAFKKHRLSILKRRGISKTGCSAHGKDLSYVCVECLQFVCSECVFTEKHRKHASNVQEIEDAGAILRENMQCLHKQVNTMLNLLSKVPDSFFRVKINESKTDDERMVSSKFLKSRCLLNEIESALQGRTTFYEQVQKRLHSAQLLCTSALSTISSSLDPPEMKTALSNIEKELEEAKALFATANLLKPMDDKVSYEQQIESKPISSASYNLRQLFEFHDTATPLYSPSEVDIKDGCLFVPDHGANFVRVISPSGQLAATYYPVRHSGTTINASRVSGTTLLIGEGAGIISVIPLDRLAKAKSLVIPGTEIAALGIMDESNILISAGTGEIKRCNIITGKTDTVVSRGLLDPQFISEGWLGKEKLFLITERDPQMIKIFNSKWKMVSSFAVESPLGTALLPSGNILIAQPPLGHISEYTFHGTFIRYVLTSQNGVREPHHIRHKDNLLAVSERSWYGQQTGGRPAIKLFKFE